MGLYVIAPEGTPLRLGYRPRQRVLRPRHRAQQLPVPGAFEAARSAPWARSCAPARCRGTCEGRSRIRRGAAVRWEKPFLTGEDNMCHSLANLEYHHFKYAAHRVPGDVHLHFFGTATLSFADGIRVEPGDDVRDRPAGAGRAAVQSAGGGATRISRRAAWSHFDIGHCSAASAAEMKGTIA